MFGIAEIGHFTLSLSFGFALVMAILPMFGAIWNIKSLMQIGRFSAFVLLGQVSLAFALLTYSFVTSDFSVKLVASHSHSLKPMIYKIAGVWGNHEGSLLLWVLILALFTSAVAMTKSISAQRQAYVISIQGMIAVAFILFLLVTSNPFTRLDPAPLMAMD